MTIIEHFYFALRQINESKIVTKNTMNQIWQERKGIYSIKSWSFHKYFLPVFSLQRRPMPVPSWEKQHLTLDLAIFACLYIFLLTLWRGYITPVQSTQKNKNKLNQAKNLYKVGLKVLGLTVLSCWCKLIPFQSRK